MYISDPILILQNLKSIEACVLVMYVVEEKEITESPVSPWLACPCTFLTASVKKGGEETERTAHQYMHVILFYL